MTWNIDGIRGKEFDIDFINYIKKHHVMILLETWTIDKHDFEILDDILDDYELLVVKHGVKLSKYGRASGGILVFVKKCVSNLFTYVEDFECGVIIKIEKDVFEDPVFYVVCYLPPSSSSFYKHVCGNDTISNGVSFLEDKLSILKIRYV